MNAVQDPPASWSAAPDLAPEWVSFEDLFLQDGRARVVDVRTPGEFYRLGPRLPGAELVPLTDLGFECRTWDPGARLVLLCDNGRRSWRGALELARRGFQRIQVLRGGLQQAGLSPQLQRHRRGLPPGPAAPGEAGGPSMS